MASHVLRIMKAYATVRKKKIVRELFVKIPSLR